MDRCIPSPPRMRKYREMGFDRHHILEAWDRCQGREYFLFDTLKKIRSRDQLCSEQRLVWNGNTRAPIKRIVNQAPLKRLSTRNDRQESPWEEMWREFQRMKKNGLLLKKEYRGSRGLSLEYQGGGRLINDNIQGLAKEMKGYLRRLRHLSIKFNPCSVPIVNIVPLLKSIKHNFVGLVSLKFSLKKVLRWGEDLSAFDRLFANLRPTLKYLDLDFAENYSSEIHLPEALGWAIIKNLQKLETLCLNFRDTGFLIPLVRFFINTACSRMNHLRTLRLQMENCILFHQENFSQARTPSKLQCLKLDFDRCAGLDRGYVSSLQSDILVACPALEELCIRLPNYKRFSGEYLSAMKEKFLQKLNLKRFAVELSHELEETLNHYEDIQAIENIQEIKIEEFVCDLKQKAGGEENFHLYCEILKEKEEKKKGFYDSFDEQDYQIYECQRDTAELKEYNEWKEIEEQEEAEKILRGYITEEEDEEEWRTIYDMDGMDGI